jgi:hypothetical protein
MSIGVAILIVGLTVLFFTNKLFRRSLLVVTALAILIVGGLALEIQREKWENERAESALAVRCSPILQERHQKHPEWTAQHPDYPGLDLHYLGDECDKWEARHRNSPNAELRLTKRI